MRPKTSIEYKTTSHSRLELGRQCPRKYKYKYVDKLRAKEEAIYFIEGTWAHEILEDILGQNIKPMDALEQRLPGWLTELGLDLDEDELFIFGQAYGLIYYRASARCSSAERIRTTSGSLLSNPSKYPTKSWNVAVGLKNLKGSILDLNVLASRQHELFAKESFADLVGRVFGYFTNYEIPSLIEEVLHVELPVSTTNENRVNFPGKKNLAFQAYIDIVFKTPTGKVVICDHKTSKHKPLPEEVANNIQLHLYAWLWTELMGFAPDAIAIHHVPSGEVIGSTYNKSITENVLSYAVETQHVLNSYENTGYPRISDPQGFNTPCINRDFRTDRVTKLCPYISKCWPDYYRLCSTELQEFEVIS